MICDRCKQSSVGLLMSMFNTETICCDCKAKEMVHPKYPEALKAEGDAVKSGNMNFPGIGKPDDL